MRPDPATGFRYTAAFSGSVTFTGSVPVAGGVLGTVGRDDVARGAQLEELAGPGAGDLAGRPGSRSR
ncbi:hypothetical protein SVIOM342S_04699 [Streptomyces violaceorubidus]